MNSRLLHVPNTEGVYVLKLSSGKYYVGYSQHMRNRVMQHFQKVGSEWTILHDVLCVMEIHEGASEIDETHITLKKMKQFGWENVRGSRWCQIDLRIPPHEITERISCFFCGDDHLVKNCPRRRQRYNTKPYDRPSDACFRCGHKNHVAANCFAKKDINGNKLWN